MKRFLSILCLLSGIILSAQENNYWSTQYGAKSNLLGGASVASFIDDGAIYYNPATLAFKDSTHISVSASAFQMEVLRTKNGMGHGLDLNDKNYDVAPQIVGGNKKISKRMELEFILLSRYIVNSGVQSVHKDHLPLLWNDSASLFQFTGEFEARNKIQEQWGGLALSYRINNAVGIGLTNFMAYRFQKSFQGVNCTALPLNSPQFFIMKLDYSRGLEYYAIRNITKAGISFNGKKFCAGLTYTFPSIHVTGKGTADNYFYIANLPDNNFIGFNEYNKGENIRPRYKSPWSAAAGLSFKTDKIKIHLAAEYFGKVKWYELYEPQKGVAIVPNPKGGGVMHRKDTAFSIRKGADAVFNWSIGMEMRVSKRIEILGGFRSDFSCRSYSFNSINDNVFSESGFNLWHSSLGFTYMKSKTTITSGFIFSTGKSNAAPQPVDFTRPTNNTYLLGYPDPGGQTFYKRIAFVIGFSF